MGRPTPGIVKQPNGNWRVRWTDENGRRQGRGGFESLANAQAFQRRVLAGVELEAATEPAWLKVLRRQLDKYATVEVGEFNPNGFFVYLLWTAAMDVPFYIGQSSNVLARVGAHMSQPDRRHRVARVTFIRCASAGDMNETESRLIRHYEPELNVLGPGRSRDWRLNGHKCATNPDSEGDDVADLVTDWPR